VGPFCSLPTSCCHDRDGIQNFGQHAWGFNEASHTCGSVCWSKGLIEAAIKDDRDAVPVDISTATEASASCRRMLNEDGAASRILPSSTFDFRLWQDTHHRCYGGHKADDLLLASWTQPPRVSRVDLACFLCEYYELVTDTQVRCHKFLSQLSFRPTGSCSDVTTDLQAYTFMFHFTRQNVKIAEYHNDTYPKSHTDTAFKNRKLLKGGDGDARCPLRRGCDEDKCANYLDRDVCKINQQCVQPIRSSISQNGGGHLCLGNNVTVNWEFMGAHRSAIYKTLVQWKPLKDGCGSDEADVG